jgi:hypothetical protein
VSTVTERVAAGAAFLDEHDPEWWRADVERAIDLDRLNIRSDGACILGQRCPLERDDKYLAFGAILSGIPASSGFRMDAWAVPLGFTSDWSSDNQEEEWGSLTAEWKRIITGRRAAS